MVESGIQAYITLSIWLHLQWVLHLFLFLVLWCSGHLFWLLRCSDLHTSAGAKVAALSAVTGAVGDIHRAWRREPSDPTEGEKARPEQ